MEELRGVQIEKMDKDIIMVVTPGVLDTLTAEELIEAYAQLNEKMKVPDQDNPNLWSTEINGHKVWGILDEGAGPNGESVFSILFPSEY